MAKEPPKLDSGGEHPTQYGERAEPPRQDGKPGTDPSERSETGLSQRFPEKHILDSGGEHDTRVDPLSKFLEEGRELPPELEREHRAVLLRPGQLIAKRFEILEMLGFGGMGAVYKVKDRALGTDCALKVMLPSLLGSETARQRFYSEIRISQEMAHDGIVRVHTLLRDEERGLEFFVMEFVEGKTLHRLLNECGGKLPVREVLDIILEVCDALEYAHRHTIHRDLKPQNIMVQPDGRIKVLDFGLAKLMSPGRLTKSSMALGTAYYQAPEQSVHLRELDQRADIYSLGVVFYQLLTGKIPLGTAKPASHFAGAEARRLDAIIAKCLEPEPEDRYLDVAALRAAILEAARPKRRKWPMAVVGIVVLACVFGAVFGMRVIRENVAQPSPAGEQSVVPQFVVPPSGGQERAKPTPDASAPDRLKPELQTPELQAPEAQEEAVKTAAEASEAKIAAMAAQQAARDAKAEEYALEDFGAGAELLKDGDAHDRLKAFDEAVAKYTAASDVFGKAEAKGKQTGKEIADLEQARAACAKAKAEADVLGASECAKARYEQALEQEKTAKETSTRPEATKALAESASLYALAAQEARAQGDAIVAAAKKAAEEAGAKADTPDVKQYAAEEREDAEGLMAKAAAEKDFTKAKGLYEQAAGKYDEAVRVTPDRMKAALEPKAGEVRSFGGIKMAWIPPGSFEMGSTLSAQDVQSRYGNEASKIEWWEGERPRHTVRLTKGFWMGQYEVTNAEFRKFTDATSYRTDAEKQGSAWAYNLTEGKWGEQQGASWRKPGWDLEDNQPVVCVSWNDAQEFITWLNKGGPGGFRLPTEAEWEYACRAGTTTVFPWGDSADAGKGWLNAADTTKLPNGSSWTYHFDFSDGHWNVSPVGSFRVNAFGLYDMVGNAWEWCQDWYGEYSSASVTDPTGSASGTYRVLRGGSWVNDPADCRSPDRGGSTPDSRYTSYGFRVARTP